MKEWPGIPIIKVYFQEIAWMNSEVNMHLAENTFFEFICEEEILEAHKADDFKKAVHDNSIPSCIT